MSTVDREAVLVHQQAVLAKFGELALRSDDLDEILSEAYHLVGEALTTGMAKVMELQKDETTLLVRAGVGWPPGVMGHATAKAEAGSSESYALQSGEPAISRDIATEKRFSYPQFIVDAGVKALVNVVILGVKSRRPAPLCQRAPAHRMARPSTQAELERGEKYSAWHQ